MHDGKSVWPMLALTFSCSVQLFHLFSSFFHLHVCVELGEPLETLIRLEVHQNQDPPGSRNIKAQQQIKEATPPPKVEQVKRTSLMKDQDHHLHDPGLGPDVT